MNNYNVIGADISFWQDDPTNNKDIDFSKMKGNLDFVIVRAGQGDWEDRYFKKSWKGIKEIGIPRGSYWFYDSRTDPKKQANKWVEVLGGDLGELPLWCDFEDKYGGTFGGWKNWYNFIVELQRLVPNKQIGIYTGYYYWIENTTAVGIKTNELNWFSKFPLWLAWYNKNTPLVPKPWSNWDIWQFTDSGDGKKYGVESREIDLNYFNGDLTSFKSRFGITQSPVNDSEVIINNTISVVVTLEDGTKINLKG